MDPRVQRDQVIKDAKCSLILDAARKLFTEKGYWETRVEDIATAAGFSKASFYNYFPDKEALFLSLLIIEYGDLIKRVDEVGARQARLLPTLDAIVRLLLEFVSDRYAIFINASNYQNAIELHAGMSKHLELMGQFQSMMERMLESFKTVITRARAAGEIASPVDDTMLAHLVGSLIQGVFHYCRSTRTKINIDAAVGEVLAFCSRGLDVRTPPVAAEPPHSAT